MTSGGAWTDTAHHLANQLESVMPISCRKGAFGESRKSALPQVARGICCRKNGWSEQILFLRPAIESPRRSRPDDATCIQAIAPGVSLRETPTFSAELNGGLTARYLFFVTKKIKLFVSTTRVQLDNYTYTNQVQFLR
jgi:hypothetical protein